MRRVVLWFIGYLLLTGCGQGDKGGISLDQSTSSSMQPAENHYVFETKDDARKTAEYYFRGDAKEIASLLTEGGLPASLPLKKTEYEYDGFGRIQKIADRELHVNEKVDDVDLVGFNDITREVSFDYDGADEFPQSQEDTYYEIVNGQRKMQSKRSIDFDWSKFPNWEASGEYKDYINGRDEGIEENTQRYFLTLEIAENAFILRESIGDLAINIAGGGTLLEGSTNIYQRYQGNQYKTYEYDRGIPMGYQLDTQENILDDTSSVIDEVDFIYVDRGILAGRARYARVIDLARLSDTQGVVRVDFFEENLCHKSLYHFSLWSPPENVSCIDLSAWKKEESLNFIEKPSTIFNISGKCIHPAGGKLFPEEGAALVLWHTCGENRVLSFNLLDNGVIKHTSSGMCVSGGDGGLIKAGDSAYLTQNCNDSAMLGFSAIAGGLIKAEVGDLCLEAESISSGAKILFSTCDNKKLEQVFIESNNHNAQLRHNISNQCIVPASGIAEPPLNANIPAILSLECGHERSKVSLLPSGMLYHARSGHCIHPLGGLMNPKESTPLIFFAGCSPKDSWYFEYTDSGLLQHMPSGKCIAISNNKLELSSNCGVKADRFIFDIFTSDKPRVIQAEHIEQPTIKARRFLDVKFLNFNSVDELALHLVEKGLEDTSISEIKEYSYDATGRLVREDIVNPLISSSFSTVWSYDTTPGSSVKSAKTIECSGIGLSKMCNSPEPKESFYFPENQELTIQGSGVAINGEAFNLELNYFFKDQKIDHMMIDRSREWVFVYDDGLLSSLSGQSMNFDVRSILKYDNGRLKSYETYRVDDYQSVYQPLDSDYLRKSQYRYNYQFKGDVLDLVRFEKNALDPDVIGVSFYAQGYCLPEIGKHVDLSMIGNKNCELFSHWKVNSVVSANAHRLKDNVTNLCLDIPIDAYDALTSDIQVVGWSCLSDKNQQWLWNDDGFIYSRNGLCLSYLDTEDVSAVIVQVCSEQANEQRWNITTEGYIKSYNNKCLSLVDAKAVLSSCVDGDAKWQYQLSQGFNLRVDKLGDAPDFCMDLSRGSESDGAQISGYWCKNSGNQQWNLQSLGKGLFAIRSLLTGKCLTYAQGTTFQYKCSGDDDQIFKIESIDEFSINIVSKFNGLCLSYAHPNQQIQSKNCDASDPSQRWIIEVY